MTPEDMTESYISDSLPATGDAPPSGCQMLGSVRRPIHIRAAGLTPQQMILEIAKAIARRLAREEYARMREEHAGASADNAEDTLASE